MTLGKKNCIITPTFSGHFCYIKQYLKSFNLFVEDKQDCEIIFTISQLEHENFKKIVADYSHLNIRVLYFEDILTNFNIYQSPQELLTIYGRFSFQTLKKFYTILYLGQDYRFLVLDSESMWVKQTNMNKLFDDFFATKTIYYSNFSDRKLQNILLQDLIKTNNQILGLSDYNLWFLETFMWFYDYNIVNAMFEKHGMPLEMCKVFHSLKKCNDTGIFEILLYNSYLHANKEKYGYKFKDVEIIFNKYLEEDLRFQYLKEFNLNFKGCCGVLEHFMLFLNKKNTASFAKIIKEMKLTIFRCEHSNDNYFEQISLLRKYSPNILAASQEHKFGLNSNNMLSIILDIAVLRKISSTVKDFVKPLINTVKWIFKPLRLVYLILRLLIKCFINTIRYFS